MKKSGEKAQGKETATARSRGRPRAFDREAALAEATRLFWLKGYEATSISDLTEAMGIGSPSLYAAFGSKEALYAEALRYYENTYTAYSWSRFDAAATAREAVEAMLLDTAAFLTASVLDIPLGCMIALSSVGSEGHPELGERVKSGRAFTLERITARLRRAMDEGEIPASVDARALARFVQTVHAGMSILARDGAGRAELEDVAKVTMMGWDARVGS